MGGNDCFFDHNIAGGGGGGGGGGVGERWNEPKVDPKIVVRSRVLRNNYLRGLFHTVQSSFVLYCNCTLSIFSWNVGKVSHMKNFVAFSSFYKVSDELKSVQMKMESYKSR